MFSAFNSYMADLSCCMNETRTKSIKYNTNNKDNKNSEIITGSSSSTKEPISSNNIKLKIKKI